MSLPTCHALLLMGALLAVRAPSQQLAQQAASAPAAPETGHVFDRACGISRDGDQCLAFGADYKVLFETDSFTFVPAFGAAAPRNLPLQLRLADIRRGAINTDLGPATPLSVDGDRVSYRRGDIVERIDVRPEGVELSYVFAHRPAGQGDLVVRLAATTELQAWAASDGVVLGWPGLGSIDIGGVTGIDAAGARCAGGLRFAGGTLELSLPAEFVDTAAYPLVLDPFLGVSFLVASTNDTEPATAYNLSTDRWLVVWRRVISAVDADLVGQRLTGTGALLGSAFAVRSAGGLNIAPTVVNCHASAQWLVAWQEATSLFGPWEIIARTVDPANATLGTAVRLDGDQGSATEPDAWGDSSASGTGAIVVWNRSNAAIAGCVVAVSAAGVATPGTDTTLATAGTNLRSPSLSASPPGTARAALVWLNQGNVRGIAIDRTLALLGSTVVIATSVNDYTSVDIDGDGTSFVCAFAADQSSGRRNVHARPLQWNGSTLVTNGTETDLATDPNLDEFQPAVGWTGGKAVVLWTQENPSQPFNLDVLGVELSATCQSCGTSLTITGSGSFPTELMPAVGTEFASGAPGQDGLIVFAEVDAAPTFPSTVRAVRHTGVGGGAVVFAGTGCGGVGNITTNGSPFGPGNPDFEFRLVNAPLGTLPILLLGFPGGELVCGPCVFTNPILLEPAALVGNTASIPFPVPCSFAAFIGTTLSAQWAVLGIPSNPCPLVNGLGSTNRLLATVDY